jgi:hypothetical protein
MLESITDKVISDAVLDAEQRIEEELETLYRSGEPVNELDQKKVDQFARKFHNELQGEDAKKMMFVMDVAIHTGETPRQLRKLVDQEGIDPLFQTRMSIHLVSKELGVSYWEAGKIVSDTVFGTED